MRLADVPAAPAYLVFHDAFDNGAMDVYPMQSEAEAKAEAATRQTALEQISADDCGTWRAYTQLPRRRVHKFFSAWGSK